VIYNHNNLVSTLLFPTPHPSLPILIAMATTMQEMHDMLGTMVEKVTMMVADLQKINDEQQDCL
jgi:hypothetical protein